MPLIGKIIMFGWLVIAVWWIWDANKFILEYCYEVGNGTTFLGCLMDARG